MKRFGPALALTGLGLVASPGCNRDTSLAPIPPESISEAPLTVARRFPTAARPGVRFRGCINASPLAIDDGAVRRVLVADGGGEVAALDRDSGERVWSVMMPAPAGEQAYVLSTPVVVGRRLVVAYHTIPAGTEHPSVVVTRLRHRVAVIDLDTHAIDPAFPIVDVSASVRGLHGDVVFLPAHALQRGALIHVVPKGAREGRVYITYGNARDLQPYHGWIFEIDLDQWRASGAAKAITASRTTTEDLDCGDENGDGARDTRCGGGLWTPAGPLLVEEGDSYSLIVPAGNGHLDLARNDYSNSLLRLGPGLTFDPACDPNACRDFSSETLPRACVESCRDILVPRLLPGESPPRPAGGMCDGKSLYICWSLMDQLDGGSTPVPVTLASGKRLLVYPTKDGHLWLVDAAHMGRVYARHQLTGPCGTDDDGCVMNWAGTIVTKPALTHIDSDPVVIVPTFVADSTHPSGVVAVKIVEDATGPRFETLWQLPPFDDRSALVRFRRHPSRATLATPNGSEEHAFVVDCARPGGIGKLLAIRTRDGKLAAERELAGPGIRFAAPLVDGNRVFVPSCDDDPGEGYLEAFDLEN